MRAMPFLKKYFSHQGRLSLSAYYSANMRLVLLAFISSLIAGFSIATEENSPVALLSNCLQWAVTAIGLYIFIALSIKRCHDCNHSGWFLCLSLVQTLIIALVWFFSPKIDPKGDILSFSELLGPTLSSLCAWFLQSLNDYGKWFIFLIFVQPLTLWVAWVLSFQLGTKGDNRYGPDPRQGE